MNLEKNIQEIKDFFLKRYKSNLAAILIFGSANTGHFVEGKSDIDTIVLLKRQNKLDLGKELENLFETFEEIKLRILHFKTLGSYKKHIYDKGSWASWITVIDGSRKVYSTREFQKFRKHLISKPIPKKKLKEYIKEKDKFELSGYFKKIKESDLTKGLFSHLRRKLQIINYYENKKIEFAYKKCLKNIKINKEEREKLQKLYKSYEKKEKLPKKEINYYTKLAKKFTGKIVSSI